ncbi:hypothetical protein HanIR_Chr09g0393541 [Helianthus annuus]|nr:hypothetical protein HanIR_Chr09g0393541 [Helianthus annuus]
MGNFSRWSNNGFLWWFINFWMLSRKLLLISLYCVSTISWTQPTIRSASSYLGRISLSWRVGSQLCLWYGYQSCDSYQSMQRRTFPYNLSANYHTRT